MSCIIGLDIPFVQSWVWIPKGQRESRNKCKCSAIFSLRFFFLYTRRTLIKSLQITCVNFQIPIFNYFSRSKVLKHHRILNPNKDFDISKDWLHCQAIDNFSQCQFQRWHFKKKSTVAQVIGRKYRPIWVSVSDLNQNRGFCRTLPKKIYFFEISVFIW